MARGFYTVYEIELVFAFFFLFKLLLHFLYDLFFNKFAICLRYEQLTNSQQNAVRKIKQTN